MAALMGIDGCHAGWVVASSREDFSGLTFDVTSDVRMSIDQTGRREAVVAIDIPIGLPENGPRACDREAPRVLGVGQGSRVFPAPSTGAVSRSDLRRVLFAEPCRLWRGARSAGATRSWTRSGRLTN